MALANILLEITGDSKQAQHELQQVTNDLAKFGRQTADAKAEIDTESARRKLSELTAKLDKFDAKDVSAAVNVKIAKATTEIARIREQLARLDKDDVTIDVNLRRDLTDRIGALASSIGKLGDEEHKTHGRTTDLNQGFDLLGKSIGLLKWPTLLTAGGIAARGLSALVGGATALASAIGTGLAGALTAAVQAYLAFGQAFGAIKLADFKGVSDALKGVTGAYKALTPAAQNFVDKLKTFQGPWDEMKKRVQENLFEGLAKGLDSAKGNFGLLSDAMAQTARVLGDLGQRVGKLLGSKEFGDLFQKITSENADILKRLGNAAIDLAPALLKILDAAKPLVDWVTKGVEAWAKQSAAWIDAKQKSGDLATFFDKAKDALKSLVDIGGSMVKALFNIGKAARGPGQDLLEMLAKAAKSFAAWTGSAEGQNTLRKYFEDLKPVLREAGKLVGDLAKAFFDVGKGTDLKGLIHSLRVELLPVLVDLVKNTTAAFGPKIIDLLVQFGKLMGKLGGSSGPLSLYVQGLTQLGKVLNFIFDTIPGVQSGTVDLIAAFALYKTLSGPVGALKDFTTAMGDSKIATAAMPKILGLYDTAVVAAGSATKLAVASTGIGALIVVAVLIATHWKQTKEILANVWDWIKTKAIEIGKWVWDHDYIFGLAAAPLEIAKHWRDLVDVFKNVWGWIKEAAGNLAESVKSAAEKGFLGPIGLIITHWKDLKDTLGEIWHDIKSTASDVWGGIKDAILTPVHAIKDVVGTVWDTMKEGARGAWHAIEDAAGNIWGNVKDAVLTPVHAIKSVAHDAWDAMQEVAKRIWGGIHDAASNIWGNIKDAILTPIHAVKGVLDDVWDGIKKAAKDAFDFLHDNIIDRFKGIAGKVKDIFDRVPNAMKSVMNAVIAAFNAAIDGINEITPGDINVGPVHIPGLPDIPHIPGLERGVKDFVGGLAMVGERGPELVNLPRGTDVYETGLTQKLLGALAGAGAGSSTEHNWNIQPIAGADYPDVDSFVAQLNMRLRRMGGLR